MLFTIQLFWPLNDFIFICISRVHYEIQDYTPHMRQYYLIDAAANIVANNLCIEISFSLPKNLNFVISSLAVKSTVTL